MNPLSHGNGCGVRLTGLIISLDVGGVIKVWDLISPAPLAIVLEAQHTIYRGCGIECLPNMEGAIFVGGDSNTIFLHRWQEANVALSRHDATFESVSDISLIHEPGISPKKFLLSAGSDGRTMLADLDMLIEGRTQHKKSRAWTSIPVDVVHRLDPCDVPVATSDQVDASSDPSSLDISNIAMDGNGPDNIGEDGQPQQRHWFCNATTEKADVKRPECSSDMAPSDKIAQTFVRHVTFPSLQEVIVFSAGSAGVVRCQAIGSRLK